MAGVLAGACMQACMHACMHACLRPQAHARPCMHMRVQELLDLYDKLEHTKKMGIVYSANRVSDVSSGTSAERMGVQPGWQIAVVCCLGARDTHLLHVCCMALVFQLQMFCIKIAEVACSLAGWMPVSHSFLLLDACCIFY